MAAISIEESKEEEVDTKEGAGVKIEEGDL
jgi:hypothetical protein